MGNIFPVTIIMLTVIQSENAQIPIPSAKVNEFQVCYVKQTHTLDTKVGEGVLRLFFILFRCILLIINF